jgi:hypothetical protein
MLETAHGQPNTPKVPYAGGDKCQKKGGIFQLSTFSLLRQRVRTTRLIHFIFRSHVVAGESWMSGPFGCSAHLFGPCIVMVITMEWNGTKKEGKELSQLPTRVGFACTCGLDASGVAKETVPTQQLEEHGQSGTLHSRQPQFRAAWSPLQPFAKPRVAVSSLQSFSILPMLDPPWRPKSPTGRI